MQVAILHKIQQYIVKFCGNMKKFTRHYFKKVREFRAP